jgi:hypothetical protein
MGALGQFIDEMKNRVIELEAERDDYKARYESLCGMIRKDANDKRKTVKDKD